MKAKLLYHEKVEVDGRYVIEFTIHNVVRNWKYPDGLKYGLICFDTKTEKKVLIDNHHPKGPHCHTDDKEFSYQFKSIEKLIDDFKKLVFNHLGVRL